MLACSQGGQLTLPVMSLIDRGSDRFSGGRRSHGGGKEGICAAFGEKQELRASGKDLYCEIVRDGTADFPTGGGDGAVRRVRTAVQEQLWIAATWERSWWD